MYELISIGSICIDLYFSGDTLTFKENRFQLAIGGKYVTDFFHMSLGGGGVNVAAGVRKLGLWSAVLGKIGKNDFNKFILSQLKTLDVSSNYCQIEQDYINISAIILNNSGERTIVHYSTPHDHIFRFKKDINKLKATKIVYFGSMPNITLTERMEILHYLKENNILTVMNLGVKDCRRKKDQLHDFLKNVNVLILNGHEFADLVKAPYKDIHFRENIVGWYMPKLTNQIVVVTEGKKGSYAYHNNKVFHTPAQKLEKIVDANGAGDGYTAGFIAEFYKSNDIEKAMSAGTKYAAKILGKIGAN